MLVVAPFIGRNLAPGKSVTLPAESTLASVYKRKKLTPRACSDYLKQSSYRMP